MLYTEKKNPTAFQIRDALLADNGQFCPLEELVATGEAVFSFIHQSQMDLSSRNAFYQLEKQFHFYKNLLLM